MIKTMQSMGLGIVVFNLISVASATEVTLLTSQDDILIGSGSGVNSNGSGDGIYVGQIGFFGGSEVLRHGLLHFDLSVIPSNATITSVTLNMNVVNSPNNNEYEFLLHRCQESWGEGASNIHGRIGAPAEPGDPTWVSRFHPDSAGAVPEGSFESESSSTTMISGRADCAFTGQGLIDDVQILLNDPNFNHGWIVIGPEGTSFTARKFLSQEYEVDVSKRPTLVVTYEEAGGTPGGFNGDGFVDGGDIGLLLVDWI